MTAATAVLIWSASFKVLAQPALRKLSRGQPVVRRICSIRINITTGICQHPPGDNIFHNAPRAFGQTDIRQKTAHKVPT